MDWETLITFAERELHFSGRPSIWYGGFKMIKDFEEWDALKQRLEWICYCHEGESYKEWWWSSLRSAITIRPALLISRSNIFASTRQVSRLARHGAVSRNSIDATLWELLGYWRQSVPRCWFAPIRSNMQSLWLKSNKWRNRSTRI